jgi:hypothetical protein
MAQGGQFPLSLDSTGNPNVQSLPSSSSRGLSFSVSVALRTAGMTLKQRFSQVHGLMDLCNATQQIHLKLPSWHFDWQQKWDRRRDRLRAAATQATRLKAAT